MGYRLAVLNSHPIQYFAPLYRRLSKRDEVDLTVYYCSRQGVDTYVDEGFGEEVQWDVPLLEGYEHRFLPNLTLDDRVGGFFSLVNTSIITELLENRYDALIIHGHSYLTNHLAWIAAKLSETAIFMRTETHLRLERPLWKRLLRKPLMTTFYRLFDGFLAIGSRNKAFYRAHGVPEERIYHVPYAVDNEFFRNNAEEAQRHPQKFRERLGLPPDSPVILYASKFVRRKRPMDLLRAFEQMREEIEEASLAFVGAGPLEDELKTYARKHDIPDVYFLGFRNQSELPEIYGCSDVFVLPSEKEPWGLVINEVMAAGLPVITTQEVGAAPDLVEDGENGFIYEAGNVDSLTRSLEKVIADPKAQREMQEESLRRIEDWDYEKCAEGIVEAMKRL